MCGFALWLRRASLLLAVGLAAVIFPAFAGSEPKEAEAIPEVPSAELKDAETQRFEAELRRYELRENVIASFVYSFHGSSPDQRAELWQQLEKDKAELAEQKRLQEERAGEIRNRRPPGSLDAETLRYQTAIAELDLPPDAKEELVDMFQANGPAFRKTLWERVETSPLNQN